VARVGVIGAGSWGTALAKLLCENGHEVTLWCRRPELAAQLAARRLNDEYLPGIALPASMSFTSDVNAATDQTEFVLIAAPSHTLRTVLSTLYLLDKSCILISSVKGIEPGTDLRMSEVIADELKSAHPIVALSGPSLAMEVAQETPTAVVAACQDLSAAQRGQALFMNGYFRVYTHRDIAGVELGGALKNIIALAAGMSEGAGFGDNTIAALINRGLVEMTRLGVRLGAEAITFAGLSGMGDLVLTCMSKKSRNRTVGEQIGRGKKLEEVLAGMHMVAEGVRTTQAVYAMTQKLGLDMPITQEVYRMLFEHKNPKQAVNDLMSREAKMEKFG